MAREAQEKPDGEGLDQSLRQDHLLPIACVALVALTALASRALQSEQVAWVFTEDRGRPLATPLMHWWQFVLPFGLGVLLTVSLCVVAAGRAYRRGTFGRALAALATGGLSVAALAGALWWLDAPPVIEVAINHRDLPAEMPHFRLPTDPREPWLELRYSGGMSRQVTWSLHSDGSLVVRRYGSVERRLSLSQEETAALATVAVAGGLMNYNSALNRLRGGTMCADCGHLGLDLHLVRIDGSGLEVPWDSQVGGHMFDWLAVRYPDVPEFRAITEISRRVTSYGREP